MTLRPTDYALLSQASYDDPVVTGRTPSGPVYQNVVLDGVTYRPLQHADDPRTGFQATSYEVQDGTHTVVIAYRGTEFGREPRQDGITDAGMAIAGINNQTPDAIAFTQKVLNKAHQDAKNGNYVANVEVTGHSLGGTHAEIMASKFGLHGQTFNAFGAAGLLQGIPAGGNQIIDNVRATDVVSAASPHFGQVRIFAVPQDTQALSHAGYSDNRLIDAIAPHTPILGKIQGDAHAIDNFVPQSKLLGHSIMTSQNQAYAQEHAYMIEPYRNDILVARTVAFAGYQTQKPMIDGAMELGKTAVHAGEFAARETVAGVHAAERAADYVGHQAVKGYEVTRDGVVSGAHAVERAYNATVNAASHGIDATVHGAKVVESMGLHAYQAQIDATSHRIDAIADHLKTAPVHLDHPAHPGHPLYQQSLSAVHRLDAQNGRTPDHQSANLAGAVTVGAKAHGLNKVDHVVLSDDGSKAFAVQGDLRSPLKHVANGVDTAQAVNTPVAQSSAGWSQAVQQHQQQQIQKQVQPQLQTPQQDQIVPQQSNPVVQR